MLALIRHSDTPLDDDQIAQAAQMNRVHVNMICRQLAEDKLIVRSRSAAGKAGEQRDWLKRPRAT